MDALFPLSFSTHIDRLDKLKLNYLEVPAEVVQRLGGQAKIRMLCTVNGSLTFPCGLVALGQGRAYITLNTQRMKQLGLRMGLEATVTLEQDPSPYGAEVPEEFAELLRQDEEGNERFHLLPPGKQRYIIHYVGSVKSSQLRIDRAIRLIENLKRLPRGKEEFREILGLEKQRG